MTKKRKISVRKILQLLLTVVVTSCCIIAMVSASRIEGSKYLSTIQVHIRNDKKYHFIEQEHIMDLAINNRHVDVMHTPLAKLDVHAIEQVIKADPWVAEAQAYIDIDRVMHMYVVQRVPVARIFEQSGESYYMDGTLSIMPLSANYIYYTTVVTNVPAMGSDSAYTALKTQIYSLVSAIQADSFWNAQISQVAIDSMGMFELVPVLGNHKILFGDTANTREKLDNLMVFYKKVLNRIGWDKYETLDLRFNNQVVASPSLPYKGPVDKATVNGKMSWINSIIITEAQNDTRDSLKAADVAAITNGSSLAQGKLSELRPLQPISKTSNIARTAVAAGGIGAGVILSNQLRKENAAAGKHNVPAKPAAAVAIPVSKVVAPARQQPAAKAATPVAKSTAVTKQVVRTKVVEKKHTTINAKDKKKIKAPARDAKNVKAAMPKKSGKPGEQKKTTTTSKDKNTNQGKPKYAYPEHKSN